MLSKRSQWNILFLDQTMRTFIIRARKGTTRWERLRSSIGSSQHLEVIAHSVINAFFIANNFREDVEVYIILDSTENFPRTIKLSGNEKLSLSGFHENAVLSLLEKALKESPDLRKDETKSIAPGLYISGFGFDKLISHLLKTRTLYLLEPKGENIRTAALAKDPVFILSDHLSMPSKTLKSLKHKGLKTISLGKKMLFASQCVVILHYELDNILFPV